MHLTIRVLTHVHLAVIINPAAPPVLLAVLKPALTQLLCLLVENNIFAMEKISVRGKLPEGNKLVCIFPGSFHRSFFYQITRPRTPVKDTLSKPVSKGLWRDIF
jgi:hypothetical protein